MPGIVYRVIPKQVLFASGGASIDLAKGLDISSYSEATLIVRVHLGTSLGGTNPLTVRAYEDAPTGEDGSEFVGAALGTAVVLSSGAPTSGTVTIAPIGSVNLPAFIRIRCTWHSSATGQAVISVDVVAKS